MIMSNSKENDSKVWCATFDLAREESNELTDFKFRAVVNVYAFADNDEDFLYKVATALLTDRFKDIELIDEPAEVYIDSSSKTRHKEMVKLAIDSNKVIYGTFYSYLDEG